MRVIGSHADSDLKDISIEPIAEIGEFEYIGLEFVALARLHCKVKTLDRDRVPLPTALAVPMIMNLVFQLSPTAMISTLAR